MHLEYFHDHVRIEDMLFGWWCDVVAHVPRFPPDETSFSCRRESSVVQPLQSRWIPPFAGMTPGPKLRGLVRRHLICWILSQSAFEYPIDSNVTFFKIASWKDFLSTAVTVSPFLRNSSASSPSRFWISAVACAAASCETSTKIFFSWSESLVHTCGAICVASESTM